MESSELRESHVSTLLLLGERAYKLKKPVSLGFLDFSTREARERACHREVELNRRLAPDVYLGVADVLGPDHRPCDHLVVMRRMPEERRLATLVSTGADVDDGLSQIARLLADFHSRAPTSPQIAAAGTRDAVLDNWEQGFGQTRPYIGKVLDRTMHQAVERLASRYLAGRQALFDSRIAAGWVRDVHGDLLAEDIFLLESGPRILDCIEFSDRLRWTDVLADVAFLAMDLERLHRPDLADRFLAWYQEFSAQNPPRTLVEHYLAYRAHVRAKVACIRHRQGGEGAAREANRLLQISLRHLERGRMVMVLVGGLPGTGKSTLSLQLSDALGWTLLSSDQVRKDLAGIGHRTSAPARYREGIYSPEWTQATYLELLARAGRMLEMGQPVVVDASWSERHWRRLAAKIARETSSDLVQLQCHASEAVVASRLASRTPGSDSSDADGAIAKAMASAFEPWPESLPIETSMSPGRHQELALAEIRRGATRLSRPAPEM